MFSFSMYSETGEVGIKSEGPGLESGDAQDLAESIAPTNPLDRNIKVVSLEGPASPQFPLHVFFSELGAQLQERGLTLVATPR